MSTLLSRPLLIDQDDHKLEIPDGRLENITDPELPHPLSSVALQASLGLRVFHLFQKLNTDTSPQLVLEIEAVLDKWRATFPVALRDHCPDTRWDEKYPNVPFMRCQINIIAYTYLLAPLKPYLLGKVDPQVMRTPLGTQFRTKGVDTCLDLMKAGERFYKLSFPQDIKYFFIIFFMFDAATVMCSAIVHDTHQTLPKRDQCILALRTAQELMDGVAHISESARISAQLLRKLAATLPLTQSEKEIFYPSLSSSSSTPSAPASASLSSSKKIKISPSPDIFAPAGLTSDIAVGGEHDPSHEVLSGHRESVSSAPSVRTDSFASSMSSAPYVAIQQPPQQRQERHTDYQQGFMSMPSSHTTGWGYVDYGTGGLPVTTAPPAGVGYVSIGSMPGGTSHQPMATGAVQPGGPLTGTYLEPLWDWERLNMDLSQGHHDYRRQ